MRYHSVFLRVVRKTLLISHSGITHQKRLMSNKLFIFQLMAVSKGGTGTRNLGRGTWDLGPGTWDLGSGSWVVGVSEPHVSESHVSESYVSESHVFESHVPVPTSSPVASWPWKHCLEADYCEKRINFEGKSMNIRFSFLLQNGSNGWVCILLLDVLVWSITE